MTLLDFVFVLTLHTVSLKVIHLSFSKCFDTSKPKLSAFIKSFFMWKDEINKIFLANKWPSWQETIKGDICLIKTTEFAF